MSMELRPGDLEIMAEMSTEEDMIKDLIYFIY
jgi:hypothetical protein